LPGRLGADGRLGLVVNDLPQGCAAEAFGGREGGAVRGERD
jgi:hypothetical protein